MKRSFRRALALLCAWALLTAIPACLAEGDIDLPADEISVAEAVEAPVDEVEDFALGGDALDPLPLAPVAEPLDTAEGEVENVEGYTDKRFTATVAVGDATWTGVNLVRDGFSGKLAAISGWLTLDDVLIEGTPAAQASLANWFTVQPGSGVGCAPASEGLCMNAGLVGLAPGKGYTPTLYRDGTPLTNRKAAWSSSDEGVVKVSETGKFTARAAGTAVITAAYGGQTASCAVVVSGDIQARAVRLAKNRVTLMVNRFTTLTATIRPEDASDRTVTWTSDDPAIASVDENGRVTGVSAGRTVIRATAANGKATSCQVTVKRVALERMEIEGRYFTLHPGDNLVLPVKLKPYNATNKDLVFASSDPAIAEVNPQGGITAKGLGGAIITVKARDNAKLVDTCKVFVLEEGAGRMTGLVIGLNPGHQIKTINGPYPLAPGSSATSHGVRTGAVGVVTGVPEYETTLQVGLKLKRLCEENGATVYITRTTNDVMLTNIDRAKMLNDANVDVALQLHCDSFTGGYMGCTTYVKTTGDWVDESRGLGEAIVKNLSAVTGMKSLGCRVNNRYMSLNWTTTPTVLVEMGFISNAIEDRYMASDKGREEAAYGIFEGLCEYYGR